MKNVLYEIPSGAKEDPKSSSCGATKNVLNVTWDMGSFELIFTTLENKSYNLSKFSIILNDVSRIFNDSIGKLFFV